jgi:transcriptional regulator with XRE-family HTH domain
LLRKAITNAKKIKNFFAKRIDFVIEGVYSVFTKRNIAQGGDNMKSKKVQKYPTLNALKGKIRESESSYRDLAEKIGMSPTTLSDKINGYSVFDTVEVDKIVHELRIDHNEIVKFFFPLILRNAKSNIA